MAIAKTTANPLEEISKLQAQIALLKDSAIRELKDRKSALEQEINGLDHEIEKITGKPAPGRRGRSLDTPARKSLTFQELKDMLLDAPDRQYQRSQSRARFDEYPDPRQPQSPRIAAGRQRPLADGDPHQVRLASQADQERFRRGRNLRLRFLRRAGLLLVQP